MNDVVTICIHFVEALNKRDCLDEILTKATGTDIDNYHHKKKDKDESKIFSLDFLK